MLSRPRPSRVQRVPGGRWARGMERGHAQVTKQHRGGDVPHLPVFCFPIALPDSGLGWRGSGPLRPAPRLRPSLGPPPLSHLPGLSGLLSSDPAAVRLPSPVSICRRHYGPLQAEVSWLPACPATEASHGLSDWPVGLAELPQRWLPSPVTHCGHQGRPPGSPGPQLGPQSGTTKGFGIPGPPTAPARVAHSSGPGSGLSLPIRTMAW